MAEIFQLRQPKDEWQFTVEVVRRPDGQLHARLMDARKSLIEAGDTDSSVKLYEIAEMLSQAVAPMRADAKALSRQAQHSSSEESK
jgi:hypothetical protein